MISIMVPALNEEEKLPAIVYDIVASAKESGTILYSLIFLYVFNVYVQYINGPSLYPTEKIRQLNIQSKRFSIAAELTTKLILSGCSLHEVAGYMQKSGVEGSSAISLKNLAEAIITFIKPIIEIKITKRHIFNNQTNRNF